MVNLGSDFTVVLGWIHVDGDLNALVPRWPKGLLNVLYQWSDNRQWYSREQYVKIVTQHRFIHHRLQYGAPFDDDRWMSFTPLTHSSTFILKKPLHCSKTPIDRSRRMA